MYWYYILVSVIFYIIVLSGTFIKSDQLLEDKADLVWFSFILLMSVFGTILLFR